MSQTFLTFAHLSKCNINEIPKKKVFMNRSSIQCLSSENSESVSSLDSLGTLAFLTKVAERDSSSFNPYTQASASVAQTSVNSKGSHALN